LIATVARGKTKTYFQALVQGSTSTSTFPLGRQHDIDLAQELLMHHVDVE
jgi:hypothetical protein